MATKIGEVKINNSYRGLRFKITRADIEQGQPNDPCACAAARALRRFFDAREVFVYRDKTYVLKKDKTALRYQTSPQLRLETIVFDRNGEFYPGEYDLYPVPVVEHKSKSTTSNGSSSPKRRNSSPTRRTIPNVRPTASQRLPRI